jgi:prolyl oligopeptidase
LVDENNKADGSETEKAENQKLYYHRLGEDQSKDVLVAEFPDHPTWRLSNEVSDCGKYLLLYIMSGCKDMLLYFADLEKNGEITGKLNFEKIVDEFEADYDVSVKSWIVEF